MRFPVFLGAMTLAIVSTAQGAQSWSIDHSESDLRFEATQQGGKFEGHFAEFSADMRFADDDLDASGFDVRVDVTSVDTGSRQRDRELPTSEWFAFEEFPEARFNTSAIRATDNGYEALGTLTIRDASEDIVLPFTWQTDGDQARMQGEVTIDRTRYGVGQGDWSDPDAVGHDVRVMVDLTLTR